MFNSNDVFLWKEITQQWIGSDLLHANTQQSHRFKTTSDRYYLRESPATFPARGVLSFSTEDTCINPSDAIEIIEKPLSSLPYSLSHHVLGHLCKLTRYEPVIGIMGKSGAGKSSLRNALFQGEATPVSDAHAGTWEVRRFRLGGHSHSMVITDLPGVGENRDKDVEHEALYRDILPELNLVLWPIKADDRTLSTDEYFWRHILYREHQWVLFVMTQADKMEPCHERDVVGIQPSPVQAQNIRKKAETVLRLFRPVHPVVAVSARTGWELNTLVSALMTALPDHVASPLMTRLQDELRTESVRFRAREQFTGAANRIFDTVESVCITSVARTILRVVRDSVVPVARVVRNWTFF